MGEGEVPGGTLETCTCTRPAKVGLFPVQDEPLGERHVLYLTADRGLPGVEPVVVLAGEPMVPPPAPSFRRGRA